jgi:hypothetical protein
MRKFITWHTTKSEYGTGSWAVIDSSYVASCASMSDRPKTPPSDETRLVTLQN